MAPQKQPRIAANGRPAKTTGRVLVGGHFHPDVAAQLRLIAFDQGTTIQQILVEALNRVFAAYGMPKIAGEMPADEAK